MQLQYVKLLLAHEWVTSFNWYFEFTSLDWWYFKWNRNLNCKKSDLVPLTKCNWHNMYVIVLFDLCSMFVHCWQTLICRLVNHVIVQSTSQLPKDETWTLDFMFNLEVVFFWIVCFIKILRVVLGFRCEEINFLI